jgi:hypothetical protein
MRHHNLALYKDLDIGTKDPTSGMSRRFCLRHLTWILAITIVALFLLMEQFKCAKPCTAQYAMERHLTAHQQSCPIYLGSSSQALATRQARRQNIKQTRLQVKENALAPVRDIV